MTDLLLFSNNAQTTVAGSLSSSGTTLSVATGTGALFPTISSANQYFVISLFAQANYATTEICWCTAVVGDNLTIVRAKESTTALSWSVGDIVQCGPTAGQMQTIAQPADVQAQTGNYAVDSGTANAMVITLVPAAISLSALIGVPIRIKKGSSANTTSTTLAVNGLTATAVTLPGGTALSSANGLAGRLAASAILEVIYDGTQFELQSTGPSTGITAGSYTNVNVTLGVDGRVLAVTNGSTTPGGSAGGDLGGTYPNPGVVKVNSVSYPASPSTNTVPIVTGSNTVTYEAVPNAALAVMAGDTIKANITGGSSSPTDVTYSAFIAALGLPFTSKFTSGQVSITGNVASAAHGLGSAPFGWTCVIHCITPELGYSAGQEVNMPADTYTGQAGGSDSSIGVYSDATNVYIAYDNINKIFIPTASGSGSSSITPANWKYVFRAWL